MKLKKLTTIACGVLLSATLIAAPHHASGHARKHHKTVVSQTVGKVNINTATLSDLEKVKGLGPKKAAAIIAYRTENGNFKSVQALTQVKGIGEKRLTKLVGNLSV